MDNFDFFELFQKFKIKTPMRDSKYVISTKIVYSDQHTTGTGFVHEKK